MNTLGNVLYTTRCVLSSFFNVKTLIWQIQARGGKSKIPPCSLVHSAHLAFLYIMSVELKPPSFAPINYLMGGWGEMESFFQLEGHF